MRLTELIDGLEANIYVRGDTDVEVMGISYDSRQLAQGGLFVCLKGLKTDGHLFIPQAIAQGAVGAVVEEDVDIPENVVRIKVKDSRKALAKLASRFFEDPTSKMTLVGVTGTNGKTTTTYLFENIARTAGKKTGLVGTVKYQIGNRVLPVVRTTPESSDLQKIFQEMVKEGVEVATIEVSSHAIHQHRVDGCQFDVLVFTNLSQDHLDYHRDIEEYFKVKCSFFEKASKEVYHIINRDDLYGQQILQISSPPVLTYGLSKEAQIRAENLSLDEQGGTFTIQTPRGSLKVLSRLRGKFNVYNSLAAATTALALGFSQDAIKKGLESMTSVPGRFETVGLGQDFMVIVDYAHTPDSLEKVIAAAKEITLGKVITVFGCGGDRDKTKRPLMGKAAARLSDFTIITTDNPRNEQPVDIIAQIETGFREAGHKADYVKIIDRREAIFKGVAMAEKGDLVLIAGKGHEQGQTFADKTVPFDDREVATEAIQERISCLQ